jgi:hypothetical protein
LLTVWSDANAGAAMRERMMSVDLSFMMGFPFWINGDG